MQGNCPQCGSKIAIDDAKIPERAFQVKCPKCATLVKFPGKGGELAPAPAPAASDEGEVRAQMMAQIRREMSVTDAPTAGGRALVSLTDKTQAAAITLTLTRQGHQVETLDDPAEGARMIEQGVYELVVTNRVAGSAAKGESLYQRLNRLNPEARRRLFVILVGDEFKTADGTQAWACLADLVLNTRDAGAADAAIRGVIAERQRLLQVFLDAKQRHEATAG